MSARTPSLHVARGNWRRGLALSLATVILWALLPIALKGLLKTMDVMTITWYRFLASTLVLGAWLAATKGLPDPAALRGSTVVLVILASLGLTGNYSIYLEGLGHITPATAQVVIQLAPIMLLLGGIFLFRERFSRLQWTGVAVFLVGLAGFFHDHLPDLLSGTGAYRQGVILVATAGVLWATYALAQKQLLTVFPSSTIMWMVYLGGSLLYLPVATPASLLAQPSQSLVLLAFCCANTLVAYGAFAEALADWEASRVSAVIALTPLATAITAELAAWLVPGMVPPESWSPWSIGGAFLVTFGSALTALGRSEARPRTG